MKNKQKKSSGKTIPILAGFVILAGLFAGAIRGCGGFGRGGGGDGPAKTAEPGKPSTTPVDKSFVTVTVEKDAYRLAGEKNPLALDALVQKLQGQKARVRIVYDKTAYATAVEKLEKALKAAGIRPLAIPK